MVNTELFGPICPVGGGKMKSSLASLALASIAPKAEVSPRRLNNAEATAKPLRKENIAKQYNETNSSQKKRKKRKESEFHKKRNWCHFTATKDLPCRQQHANICHS